MKKIYILLIVAILSFSKLSFAQLHFQEKIKANTVATKTPKSIFFIDFWASWCGPCIHLWKQLEVFQEYFPDDLYILSLTKENKGIVAPFLQKHSSSLAVAIDKQGFFHKEIGVSLFPYGVIYNASGDLLWQGNPSDLTFQQLKEFIDAAKKKISIDEFFSFDQDVVCLKELSNSLMYTDFNSGNYKLLKYNSPFEGKEAVIQKQGDYLAVTGGISHLLAFLLKCSSLQIKLNNIDDAHYTLLLKYTDAQKIQNDIFKRILSDCNLQFEKSIESKDVLMLSIDNSDVMFWDKNQIDWDKEQTQFFLLENGQLLADNCSLEMLGYKISSLKNIPILVKTPESYSSGIYDWNVHYKYDNLMESSLSGFGITANRVKSDIPVYYIEAQ